jgi:tetratricopeptide (TPR) repeat protein
MKPARLLLAVAVAIGVATVSVTWSAVHQDRAFQRLVALGDEALTAGRSYEAVEAFSGALVLNPGSVIGHLKRSEAYRQREELAAALRDLESATLLEPSAPRPLELLGDLHLAMTNFPEAARYYEAFAILDDRDPRVLYKLGYAYRRGGRPTAAIEPLTRAIAMDDGFAEGYYLLGLVLGDTGRAADALTVLERAVELNPAMIPSREAFAAQLGRSGHEDGRLEQLEALAALEPDQPERLIAVGLEYAARGRRDDAVVTLGRAAERYPQTFTAHEALGRVWLDSAERSQDPVALTKALEALQLASADPSATSATHALWGRALLINEDLDGAARALRIAVSRFPVVPEAFRDLASVEARLGNRTAAAAAEDRYAVLLSTP